MWGMWWWPRQFFGSASGDVEPGAGIVQPAKRRDFSSDIAHQVVRGHSWDDVSAWRWSDKALDAARSSDRALALVVLRAAILDEMESRAPAAFREFLSCRSGRTGRR